MSVLASLHIDPPSESTPFPGAAHAGGKAERKPLGKVPAGCGKADKRGKRASEGHTADCITPGPVLRLRPVTPVHLGRTHSLNS